jgi:hypothetical protein
MWARFLSSRWCIPVSALIGMLLVLPAMNMGLLGDDYLHWALLTGHAPANHQPGSFFGLFTFSDGLAQTNQAMIDSGQLVWWANPHLRIAFWRPLAELSQWLDYRLWPGSPLLMHLHNLLLYGVMILLVGKLLRELDPGEDRRTGLATLLFAGNMLHVFAVAWIASRNQMLCGILLVLTMLAYHRWREGRGALYGLAAAVLTTVGLVSAEAGIQTAGYLGAYAIFYEAGGRHGNKTLVQRLLPLLPFVLIVLVWKAVHSHLGYGSFGSPGYVDPTSGAGRFVATVMLRLPALMAAQWLGISSVMFEQLDRPVQLMYAAAATVLLLGLFWLMARLGALRTPLARFYLAGAIWSLMPACAGYPFDRLTVNADIGASGLLAIVLMSVWAQRKQLVGFGAGSLKYVLLLVGLIHLVIFPIGKLGTSVMMKPLTYAGEDMAALALPDADPARHERFLLVNPPPSGESVYYFALTRLYHHRVNPEAMMALGPNNQAMTLTRVDQNALRLDVPSGYKGTITRDVRAEPFKVGDTVRMGEVKVTVQAVTDKGWPRTVLFAFPANALQAPDWRLFAWDADGVRAVPVPAPGQSLDFPAYDLQAAGMKVMGKRE